MKNVFLKKDENGKYTKATLYDALNKLLSENNNNMIFSDDRYNNRGILYANQELIIKLLTLENLKKLSTTPQEDIELLRDFIEHETEKFLKDLQRGRIKGNEILDNILYDATTECPFCHKKLAKSVVLCPECGCSRKDILVNKFSKKIDAFIGNLQSDSRSELFNNFIKYRIIDSFTNKKMSLSDIGKSNANIINNIFLANRQKLTALLFQLCNENFLVKNVENKISYFKKNNNTKGYSDNEIKLYTKLEVLIKEIIKEDVEIFYTIFSLENYDNSIIKKEFEELKKHEDLMNPMSNEVLSKISTLEKQLEIPNKISGAKCPNCGRETVSKISNLKRGLSIGMFGIYSTKLGKTMECKSCGYKW